VPEEMIERVIATRYMRSTAPRKAKTKAKSKTFNKELISSNNSVADSYHVPQRKTKALSPAPDAYHGASGEAFFLFA
jgi:hypothetical protein